MYMYLYICLFLLYCTLLSPSVSAVPPLLFLPARVALPIHRTWIAMYAYAHGRPSIVGFAPFCARRVVQVAPAVHTGAPHGWKCMHALLSMWMCRRRQRHAWAGHIMSWGRERKRQNEKEPLSIDTSNHNDQDSNNIHGEYSECEEAHTTTGDENTRKAHNNTNKTNKRTTKLTSANRHQIT